MQSSRRFLILAGILAWSTPILAGAESPYWVEPMRKVHARFTGTPGTLALLGDSITVSLAFWAPLEWSPAQMSPEMAQAHTLVRKYLKPDCWRKWRGPDYGNESGMTI